MPGVTLTYCICLSVVYVQLGTFPQQQPVLGRAYCTAGYQSAGHAIHLSLRSVRERGALQTENRLKYLISPVYNNKTHTHTDVEILQAQTASSETEDINHIKWQISQYPRPPPEADSFLGVPIPWPGV